MTVAQSTDISLLSPVPQNGKFLCPDQEITLKCTTRGSASIAWMSQAYVGDQLLLSSFRKIGYNVSSTSVSGTVATLIDNYTDSGEQVLESTLHIIPSLNYLNATVECAGNDSIKDQFAVQVVGKYMQMSHN